MPRNPAQQLTPTRRRLVSIQDGADYFGVSVDTIRRRISDGTIKAWRIGNSPRSGLRIDLDQAETSLLHPVPAVEAS